MMLVYCVLQQQRFGTSHYAPLALYTNTISMLVNMILWNPAMLLFVLHVPPVISSPHNTKDI